MRFRGARVTQAEPAEILDLADLIKKQGQDNHITPCTPLGGAANMAHPANWNNNKNPEQLYGPPTQYTYIDSYTM